MDKRKSVLFISRDISTKKDGGTLVSKRNERLLQKLGYNVSRLVVSQPKMSTRLHNYLYRESYGETSRIRKELLEELKKDYDLIFFDSSTYGGFVKLAHSMGKKCLCFYHNVEYTYYSKKYEASRKLLDRLIIPYIKYNEKLATKYCDCIITLTDRDSIELKKLYGRGADLIIPTSFESRDLKKMYKEHLREHEPYLLFVGTNFFANVEGLTYFINNIAPYIDIDVIIAGNIEEAFHDKSNIPKNVKFMGQVESLDELYINATAVIAPIMSGSGLKTKTAEALSFGKTVVGFEEAFAGIDADRYPEATVMVKNTAEFIEAINNLDKNVILNDHSIKLFEEELSDSCYLNLLRNRISSL